MAGNTTSGGPTAENTLTVEKLRDMMRALPPTPAESDLFNPFARPRLMGREIWDAPPPAPKIQVADIKLKDGTRLLPAEFRARINNELIALFGYRDDPFKDKIYLLGSYGMVMRPEYRRMIVNLSGP
jgi:hypothetical protein